ncbi:flagellar basal body-associated FliL family protein [Marinospirillum sp. MEB164]|uniref:Flagellar protein FliL n=1 Tax=Marinospirillum alkalitolerans TaxID=3123374 RepID=A0ABW8PTZ3_9GAMM
MAEEEGGKNKKLLLIGGLVVGLAIIAALAVGGTLFFLDRSSDENGERRSLIPSSSQQIRSAYYHAFEEPFVVPLMSSDRRQRFMQVSLAVRGENQAVTTAVERHLPLIKNNLNLLFSRQDYQTLQTPEGKIQLQMAAAEAIQSVLERENVRIDEVLITDFVLQ